MPKRGGGRGGSRGGRSKPNRGGRGGYIGGKLNKYNKKTRNRKNGHKPPAQGDFPELFDLNNPDFISVSHPERSMRAAAARGSKRRFRLQDEAFNTQDNLENTMKLPIRKRPVEFVKASTYDPSKDIIRKLREKEDYLKRINDKEGIFIKPEANEDQKDQIFVENKNSDACIENDSDNTIPNDSYVTTVEEDTSTDDSVDLAIPYEQPKPNIVKQVVETKMETVPDHELFFKDEDGDSNMDVKVKYVEENANIRGPSQSSKSGNTEFDPTLSIGHVLLSTRADSNGNIRTSLPKVKSKKHDGFDPDQSIYEFSDDDEELIEYNKSQTKDLYQSYNRYISRVMQNLAEFEKDEEDEKEDEEDNIEERYENEVFAELDDDFEEEAKFIASGGFSDQGNESLHSTSDKTADHFRQLNIKEDEGPDEEPVEESKDEPEYGFLPEDYESFDNSSVDVINIRFGAGSNQYFMKSFLLTGSSEFSWIDQELFQDYLLDNGMPEHRLNAYFKYIQTQLEPPAELDEKDFDLPISDSDSEQEEEEVYADDDEYDDEGLDDLVNFTTKYDGVRDAEYETKTLTTRGKGRKKELNLDHIADLDLRQSLTDQYQDQRRNKKGKKKLREDTIAKEHANSNELSLKYPYTLHVKDIRIEYEKFLEDSKRNALTFPPLDPHGNKVLMKFAYLFNMKSRKFGQGKQQHIVSVKTKRTFHTLPDFHSIAMLCKQRPIFNRIDQKRPRVEIEAEESKSSRRGKPSKAHVKEGDIVGADAPEIASDNIGRRLLEKLGWKAGQGLGSDNRGIPEPVIAKVKKTKLGLR